MDTTCVACRKVLEDARVDGFGSSPCWGIVVQLHQITQAVQKTYKPLKALCHMACTQFCPPYPQSGPQYPGATPKPETPAMRGLWATQRAFMLDLLKRICQPAGRRPAAMDRTVFAPPEIALPAAVFPTVAHRVIHRMARALTCIKNQPLAR